MPGDQRHLRKSLAGLFLILLGCGFGCRPTSEPFLVLSGPQGLTRFEVRDGREELVWSLRAEQPTTLRSIYYGVVPEGFVQTFPEGGVRPRNLLDGEALVCTTMTLRREFKHFGFARGSGGFQGNYSLMRNLGPAELDDARADRAQ